MNTHMARLLALAALLALLPALAACQAPTPTPNASPPTPAPALITTAPPASPTPRPSATATITALPPSPTPLPTASAAPTATPISPSLLLFEALDAGHWTIWQMNGDGTNARAVVPWDPAVDGIGMYPRWAPDGRHFGYVYRYREGDEYRERVFVADREGGQRQAVGEPADGADFEWYDGDILWLYSGRAGGSFTQTYQLSTGAIFEGDMAAQAAGYGWACSTTHADSLEWSSSPDCRTVAMRKKGELEYFLFDVSSGRRTVIFTAPEKARDEYVFGGQWSPDGQTLVFEYHQWGEGGAFSDLYTVAADGSGLRPLTDWQSGYHGRGSPTNVNYTTWSPDGRWLAFHLEIAYDGKRLCVMPAGGGEIIDLGVDCSEAGTNPVWSPDSTKIAFASNRPWRLGDDSSFARQWDLYTVDIYTKAIQRLTNDNYTEMHIDWR